MNPRLGLAGRIAAFFIDSKLTPLVITASLLLGLFAVLRLPREEEPQIIVPMIDVMVQAPGMSAKEVEERVTSPMEKLLWEIPGVEYLYSTSSDGQSLVIVRFLVGHRRREGDRPHLQQDVRQLRPDPAGRLPAVDQAADIDDVPILALTFSGPGYGPYELRRVAAEVERQVKAVPDVSETMLIGGLRRQIRVTLDPTRMAGYGLSPLAIAGMLQGANQELSTGSFSRDNTEFRVKTGDFLTGAEDAANVVVGARDGRPVFLRDVAAVEDGPEEPSQYVYIAPGRGGMAEKAPAKQPPAQAVIPSNAEARNRPERGGAEQLEPRGGGHDRNKSAGGDARRRQAQGDQRHRPRRSGPRPGRRPPGHPDPRAT